MAGILLIALGIVSVLIPNSLNGYTQEFPSEEVLEPREERPSV
jgi:hypothetical protein